MNTTKEENGIVTTRNENGDIIGQHNSRVCAPRLEVSINKRGGSVSATGASIASSRVIGIFDGPRGGVAGSRAINPSSFVAVNLMVGEQSGLGVGCDSDIPIGIGVARNLLHVIINLADDLGVGHSVELELGLCFANVRDDGSPLAFGADPASAGDVPKVPKAQGLAPSACSDNLSASDVEAMITNRLVAYHQGLIRKGQIHHVDEECPSAIHQPSHCIQSEHTHRGVQQEGLVPPQCDPLPLDSNEHERE